MTKKIVITLSSLLLGFGLHADPNKTATMSKTSVREYIKQWSPTAVENMSKYRIPASIILAQGILESGYGNSRMARVANNHFGIKCLGWKGEGYYQQSSTKSCYRKYRDSDECFRDHARIISSKGRYSFLFNLDITDYKSWARGLKNAGYATHSSYDRLLIKTIENYRLFEIDRLYLKQSKPTKSTTPRVTEPEPLDLALAESPMESFERISKDIFIQVDSIGGLIDETVQEVVAIPEDDYTVREVYLVPEAVKLKYIVSVANDSYESISEQYDLLVDDLLKFNDLDDCIELLPGTPVYLEEKSKQGVHDVYTLRPGQTLWDVAQINGVRLRSLEHMNHLRSGDTPLSGSVIILRTKH